MSKLVTLNILLLLSISVINFRLIYANALPLKNADSALDFILLHNNDLHGHFEEMSSDGNECTMEGALEQECYGGFARASTLVKRYRSNQQTKNGLPVLFLNGGDTYTGTPYFQMFKDKITSEFMNILKPDVGALGNHEFDYGVSGLLPYLRDINFPIAVANLDIPADHPLMQTQSVQPSVVFHVNGTKIGVIGYITPETKNISKTNDVDILPEIDAINKEAEKLTGQGVNIIIALGHSGYEVDQEIARECPLVDLVVGAHSHTFLYTGTPPDSKDKPLGPYPTVIEQKNGKQVPVVQAYCYSKYLGKLELSFDRNGNLIRWSGHPILLDYQIPQDAEVLNLLAKYRPSIEALTKDIVTYSKVELKNDCRDCDCNIGNFIGDAWIYQRVQQYNRIDSTNSGWTDASIALINAGSIRTSASIGKLSKFTMTTMLPFENTLYVLHVPGTVVKEALELAMKDFILGEYAGHILQMSGLRVIYNLQKEGGQRVHSVEVLCANCSTPAYEPLDDQKTYGVILESYVYDGGDGFNMFKPYKAIEMNITGPNAVFNYMRHFESIYPAVEGRIKFIGVNDATNIVSQSASSVVTPLSVFLIVASLLVNFYQ